MRKRILNNQPTPASADSQAGWMNLDQIATVEVTSEDSRFPIESAFTGGGQGWRAEQTGEQQIRLIFDEPVSVHGIQVRFEEPAAERTQEFTLRWSVAHGGASTEIVRQQWNFNPQGSETEIENYAVDLEGVSVLELTIRPDISSVKGVASLAAFRVK